jgi:ribonucleoside-triphosphate reductase
LNTTRLRYRLGQQDLVLPEKIQKRNGAIVPFDVNRIGQAIDKCYRNEGIKQVFSSDEITQRVAQVVASKYAVETPTVEQVQDAVELTLLTLGEVEAARLYIKYRNKRDKERNSREVPEHVREAFDLDKQYFKTPAQAFMHFDKYAKFNFALGRRETWRETVDRAVDHLKWEVKRHGTGVVPDDVWDRIHSGILEERIAPSMRLLAMAGEAAQRNSLSLYNCAYLPIDSVDSFVETLLISMAGCGVGFSVERENVEKFPRIVRQTGEHIGVHKIDDSTEGWGDALRLGLETWWRGADVDWDASGVRKAGSILRTKGGRASGPDPLLAMLSAVRSIILSRQGSFVRTTDAHLVECWIGEAAVQGGVRRTAMISLFDWDDHEMRTIKNGPAPDYSTTPTGQNVLWNANNSAVWPDDISNLDIVRQMLEMAEAKSGEPGIFSRANAIRSLPTRRESAVFGTNPCGEIVLRPMGLCNLSQAIARKGDTEADLYDKVELATIVGVVQSLSTRFPGLRDEWKQNCEEERLLGVDLTAQRGCELLQHVTGEGAELRSRLELHSVEVSKRWAEVFGINSPAANTCTKPAGNSAERYNVPNGIHAPKARFVLRRYTVGAHGPMFRILRDAGAPMEPRYGSTTENATQWILEIPRRTDAGTPLISELSAVDQLEFWLMNKLTWTEHNPSCTITYQDDEFIDLVKWVCDHKDVIGGLSFFPASDAIYKQAPFEEITEEEYDRRAAEFPEVDYALLYAYELDDMTTAAQELACFAGDGTCAL